MNDLISRQAAISHVDDVPYIKDHPNVGLLWKAWIESLPSAQPERIKGHWVEIASSNHTYKCSMCGRLLVNITDGKNNECFSN